MFTHVVLKKFVYPTFSLAKGSYIRLDETGDPLTPYRVSGTTDKPIWIIEELYQAILKHCVPIDEGNLRPFQETPPKVQVFTYWEENYFKLEAKHIVLQLNLKEAEQLLTDLSKAVEFYKKSDEKVMWRSSKGDKDGK
jgi:hypothetical protein